MLFGCAATLNHDCGFQRVTKRRQLFFGDIIKIGVDAPNVREVFLFALPTELVHGDIDRRTLFVQLGEGRDQRFDVAGREIRVSP